MDALGSVVVFSVVMIKVVRLGLKKENNKYYLEQLKEEVLTIEV